MLLVDGLSGGILFFRLSISVRFPLLLFLVELSILLFPLLLILVELFL